MTTRAERDKENLAIASPEKPKLLVIQREIEQALTDASGYYTRMDQAEDYWRDRWNGQGPDGRKHRDESKDDAPFPWEGAADSRPQVLGRKVREHVMVDKFAFKGGKLQATSYRPLVNGQDGAIATRILKWLVHSHMLPELNREYPLSSAWRHAYGCSFMGIKWETARRTDYVPLSLEILDQFVQTSGVDPQFRELLELLYDPRAEASLVQLIGELSPLLTTGKSRRILRDLQTKGETEVPVPTVYLSKPKWYALRAVVDLLFPLDTSDLQAAPWVAERELVDEVTLRDRIETEDYDEPFVEALLEHKGKTDNAFWRDRTETQRSYMTGLGRIDRKNSVELFHVVYKTIERGGAPCLYRTIFNPLVNRGKREGDKMLCASHAPFPYDHGEYPYVTRRFETEQREILSSRGIPEIAYTHSLEIKAQRDARTDRTAIVNAPPMIVPHSRVKAIKGQFGPRAVLGVTRANEVRWLELPPSDNSPVMIEQQVLQDIDDRFPLFGPEVDPDKKSMYRGELSGDCTAEAVQMYDQTMKLAQQYEPDEVVQQVAGPLQRPFHQSRQQIQGAWQLTIAFDVRMIDEDYAMARYDAVAKIVGTFNMAGNVDTTGAMKYLFGLLDPDLPDLLLIQDDKAAEKEKRGAQDDVLKAINGIVPEPPMMGNHKLRLQTIMETVMQPAVQRKVQADPEVKEILKQLIQFHQNQIQQYQNNPQIGRTLALNPNNPRQALPTRSPAQVAAAGG